MKFKNKKTEIDGIIFDSELESKYYLYLQEQRKAGIVIAIQTQPVFELIPSFRKNKRTIRPIKYKADYRVRYADGHEEIVDIKTEATMTPAFRLKWKLFDFYYPDLELLLITLHKNEWIRLEDKPKTKGSRTKGTKGHGKTKKARRISVSKRKKDLPPAMR